MSTPPETPRPRRKRPFLGCTLAPDVDEALRQRASISGEPVSRVADAALRAGMGIQAKSTAQVKVEHDVLLCPGCGGSCLHHLETVVHERRGEDGDGISVVVNGCDVATKIAPAKEFAGRRNDLSVSFWCEACDDIMYILRIVQHKGQTIVTFGKQ